MNKFLLTVACFCMGLTVFAQNKNVVFRSKMTFPGQTVANVWGYADNGREYALVGAAQGLIIVDITDPDAPQQITQIPGPNNLWKEVRTYREYAYIVSEGGQGVQVINLGNLPSANLQYHHYRGDGPIQGQLGKIHALQIDIAKGFLYAYGGNLFSGGAKVFDLNADPYNPSFVGKFDQLGYIHDGYVDNDTMYSGHIYLGQFAVVDMHDKSAPDLLATQNTPNNFTHNTWLSEDHQTLFTTDERNNSFLAAFDISDLDNITLLDKIQSNPGSNSIVHNTHIKGNFAITAWYKDGFTIVDVSHPDNLVQVGNYDTYPNGAGGGFDGCWGVYPYFPSGTIIASTIEALGTNDGELFVLTPQYVRACYLEGTINNGLTGTPLNGVKVEILGSAQASTLADGRFRMGQEEEGYFTIQVSKPGFQMQEYTAYLQRGKVKNLNTSLYPVDGLVVDGQVIDDYDNTPVPNALVTFSSWSGSWEATTDATGAFMFTDIPTGLYDIVASAPGLGHSAKYKQKITSDKTLMLTISSKINKFIPGPSQSEKRGLVIWPNPFNKEIQLSLSPDIERYHLQVVDPFGRIVYQIEEQQTDALIRVGDTWPPGVYFIHIDTQNGELPIVKKVIKTR